VLAVHDPNVETTRARRRDLFGAGIDTGHEAAKRGKLLRQRAVAAAEIEDALAGLRSKELHERLPKLRYKPRICSVSLRVPGLPCRHGKTVP